MHRRPTTVLYRPVGSWELELVRQSGFKASPPRLPEQAASSGTPWQLATSSIGPTLYPAARSRAFQSRATSAAYSELSTG
jgi:hypothetical protein